MKTLKWWMEWKIMTKANKKLNKTNLGMILIYAILAWCFFQVATFGAFSIIDILKFLIRG